MEHIFEEGPITTENLAYVLKKNRGLLNKMRKSFENERKMRFAEEPEKAKECLRLMEQLHAEFRTMTLYAEMQWTTMVTEYHHVRNIPDVLKPGVMFNITSWLHPDRDVAWNILKTFLKDKVLGPAWGREYGQVGVYCENPMSYISMADAEDMVVAGKKAKQ